MSLTLAAPARSPPDVTVVAGLALAATIAWFQPFDVPFAAATLGQPLLRALLLVTLALFGLQIGPRVGLRLHGGARSLALAVGLSLAVALGCALADVLFRPVLRPDYLRVMTEGPLALRTTGYMMRAVNENILYRLFLGSLLAAGFGQLWRDEEGRPAEAAIWCAFAISQAVNVWANVLAGASVTPEVLAHAALRYFAPGMAWSWLYRRHGFLANEVASTTVHLAFQPLAGLLLRG